MLEHALAWAARGLRVFPIAPGTKTPPKGMRFKQEATTDPETICRWWKAEPRYNVGVAGGSGWLIVDVDAGKGGFASLMDLDLPDATLTVQTPGGGIHLYFRGPDVQNSVDRLAPGIDIRSEGGYVVGPGSFFADPGGEKGYTGHYKVAEHAPAAEAPAAFVLRCGEPRARDAGIPVSTDHPDDIVFAIHYLEKDAPPAIEGRGGNGTTYAVAARLTEIGLSAESATALMLEHWNERCDPPWHREDLLRIATNASSYAQTRQGSGGVNGVALEGGDASDAVPSPPPPSSAGKFDRLFALRALTPIDEIPARDWIVNRLLMRREATVVAGPGGVGKSGFSIALACHGAMGQSFAGYGIPRPFKTLVYNLEDDLHEMEARLYATCALYVFDPKEVEKSVLLWPGREMRFRLLNKDHTVAVADIKELARLLRSNGFDAVILDPLRSLHSEEEADNTAMSEVMEALNALCRLANVAGLGLHHVPKGVRLAGSTDAARGAGAITNDVRIVHTMYAADEADAALYGLGEGFRGRYVRIDGAKMNHGPMETRPTWFEKQSYLLPNGDTVQAMKQFVASESAKGEAKLMATVLASYMDREGTMHLDTHSATKALTEAEPVFREAVPISGRLDALRARLEMRLIDPVRLENGAVICVQARTEPGSTVARRYVTLASPTPNHSEGGSPRTPDHWATE